VLDMQLYVPHPRSRGFGHYFRSYALKEAYESLGGKAHIHFDAYPNDLTDCIAVFDGLRPTYHKYDNVLIAYIDDCLPLEDYRVDLVINQNSHIDAPYSNLSHLYGTLKCEKLIGFDYFMRRTDYDSVNVCDEGYVAFVPGSASLLMEHPFVNSLMSELNGYDIRILHNMPPNEIAQAIASAHLVITACSVSSLEACSLGKPVLVHQTSGDQHYLYSALTYLGIAQPVTKRNLFELLHSDESRRVQGERAKRYVPTNGAIRVAKRIIEKAKEIGLCS
jgi:spore coat polysaccharide biosynthesis predicted glycosyltransferase SpsG